MTASDAPVRKRYPSAERREQLIDVAEGLFIEHGYAAVTMEDIARAAGVSRPVPYNHFGSKEGAYIACVRRIDDEYNASLVEVIDPDAEPKEQISQGGRHFFETLALSGAVDGCTVNLTDDAPVTVWEMARLGGGDPLDGSAAPLENPWSGRMDGSLARELGFRPDVPTIHAAAAAGIL